MINFAAPGGGPDGPPWLGIVFGIIVAVLAVVFFVHLAKRRK
ncbi:MULTISPECIES: hypothetical protein [Streptomyces]|nr:MULTISPECIES: hypothetical protein [Streptomyces]SDD14008.1 hypothetical protein F610DRAFT_03670 [Streptomyces sp. LaPpAH-199]